MSTKNHDSVKTTKKAAASAEPRAESTEPVLTDAERTKARKAANEKIILFAAAQAEKIGDVEMTKIIAPWLPKARKAKAGAEPTWSIELRRVMGDNVSIHEDAVWRDYKFGRESMAILIKDAVVREKPAYRFWVQFDMSIGNYRLMGVGEKMPDGWTGPLPKELRTSDIERLNSAQG